MASLDPTNTTTTSSSAALPNIPEEADKLSTYSSSSSNNSQDEKLQPKKQDPSRLEAQLSRTITHPDIDDPLNLPYRTLTQTASMAEYTQETPTGLHTTMTNRSGKPEQVELVMFKDQDPGNPKNWSKAKKWWITMVVALTCFCVALNSAVVTADIAGVSETFGVSEEVSLLTVTLFVGQFLLLVQFTMFPRY